jgi:hypothetical protein
LDTGNDRIAETAVTHSRSAWVCLMVFGALFLLFGLWLAIPASVELLRYYKVVPAIEEPPVQLEVESRPQPPKDPHPVDYWGQVLWIIAGLEFAVPGGIVVLGSAWMLLKGSPRTR